MFNCEFCDGVFPTKRGKQVHEGRSHKDEKQKVYELENPFGCPYCDKRYKKYTSLSKHATRMHDVAADKVYADYYFDGRIPLCKCGCGQEVNFNWWDYEKGFRDFLQGHYARTLENGFWTEEGLENSAETRREQFASGEREPWNKGLSLEDNPEHTGLQKLREVNLKENCPERARKISEALTGREISAEERARLDKMQRDYWSNEANRERQSHRRMVWMKENDYTVKSSLEVKVAELFDLNNIRYEEQFYVRDTKSYYDFYLPEYDALIEVHGDFWHCNPNSKFSEPKYKCQKVNLERDDIKKRWCLDNNKKLLIFWETDINERPETVMEQLLTSI